MDTRNDRVVHLHMAATLDAAPKASDERQESATVVAYKAGLNFGRQLEWRSARAWWFASGMAFGTALGAVLAAACWTLWRIPAVL